MSIKSITATFQPQAWQGDIAINIDGIIELDVTQKVLALKLSDLRDIVDHQVSSDDLIDMGDVSHEGPFSVTVESSICEYFGVAKLDDITEGALCTERALWRMTHPNGLHDKPEVPETEVLFTRQDGQIFGIEILADDEFQSVVPSELAEAGEGYVHATAKDARSYLLDLLAQQKDITVVHVCAWEINGDTHFKWNSTPEWANKTFEACKVDLSQDKPAHWAAYRFDVAVPATYSDKLVDSEIEANLRHFCDTAAESFDSSAKEAGATKIVEIRLSAMRLVEYTQALEVPVDMSAAELNALVNHCWAETDGGEFTLDPNYFERGECSAVPGTGGLAVTGCVSRNGHSFSIGLPKKQTDNSAESPSP